MSPDGAFPELERLTTAQEEELLALAGRLDAIAGGGLRAQVQTALTGAADPAAEEDAQLAMIRRLTTLRIEIVHVAVEVDGHGGTPRPIAGEIADDFEARRNHLPVLVHDRAAGDVEAFAELREDDVLRYVSGPQQDALISIAEMLLALERAG